LRRAPSILFVHDNFPAQFGTFGAWLADRGWDVTFATTARTAAPRGTRMFRYAAHREPTAQTHPYALAMERAAIKGQGFARRALAARRDGLRPDVIVAHTGWGSGLYARDVFPRACFVPYCEWWYNHPGADVAFLAALMGESAPDREDAGLLERGRNAPIALDLAGADAAICPTRFQAAQFPQPFRDRLTILHDGIDTEFFRPDPGSASDTLDGLIPEGAQVITYATRGMEPHRGFPSFMEALPKVFAAVPDAVAIVAGRNEVAYGGDAIRRIDWKARALAENDIDPARIRFVGTLPKPAYRRLLRRSDAHVYLTVPFVLSWSMLEAMSTACALVASDTACVTEFAEESSARLVDIRSHGALATGIIETLLHEQAASLRRKQAREAASQLCKSKMFRARERLVAELCR
jgi:glycosyltransferase involved in cell wall biosynthesis